MQLDHALDAVHAELLPEDKARIIEAYKKEGPTAMIGDGINDAPALATADIGISMGISGSALAMETGHVILMSNDIRKIPKAIQLARRTLRKLIENVVISITTKGAILALAFAGYPLIWAAVLTDVGTCLIVIFNSMLLLQETPKFHEEISRAKYGTFSTTSPAKVRNMNPAAPDGSYNGGSGLFEATKCGDGCCKKVIDHDLESPSGSTPGGFGPFKFRFHGKNQITNSVGRQGGGINNVERIKQCTGECGDKVTDVMRDHGHSDRFESRNDACTSPLLCQDKEFAATTECNSVCCLQNREALSKTKKCGSGCGAERGETINTAFSAANLEEYAVTDASTISDRRDITECSEQSEQCCVNRRQSRAGFVDGLSEIVIN